MKKYIYNIFKALGLAFVFVLVLSSCSKWINTDINNNPDAPADVPMYLMLPAIEQSMGYNIGGNDIVMTTNMWMQQFTGTSRQALTESRYQLLPADVNNVWNSFYTEVFMNAKVMIEKAENTEGEASPYYAGIGRVLIATTLGITTDLFGDMPFSKAFRGADLLTPAFDTQAELYDTLTVILDKAIVDLNSETNLFDIEGDVVYGRGTPIPTQAEIVAKWKKAAYSIKARHALQLAAVNGNAAYQAALTAAANGFASNADDYQVPWETANANPFYQFIDERDDFRMGATLIDLMKLTDDPRLPFYAAEDGDHVYSGSAIGFETATASKPGDFLAAIDAPTVMMSYAELKFIVAEAKFMLGQDAQADFEEAVAASVLKVTGDANTAWLDANINGVTLTHELIMTQKYIATVGTNQAYADYRRTGLPDILVAPHLAVLPALPARFPYAQEEITYNGANVPSVQISDKLWWDQ